MPVSLIATDFYEQGALIDVAEEINRAALSGWRRARLRPTASARRGR